jgi:hypothetical protein
MDDKEFVEKVIKKMSERELLDYVMAHPEYLTDSYYFVFSRALNARYDELCALRDVEMMAPRGPTEMPK